MKTRPRALIAVTAAVLSVGASQWAMRGRHEGTGNAGYLGTESAGVEGVAGSSSMPGVRGQNPTGSEGQLGGLDCGVLGTSNATGVIGFSGVGTGVIGNGVSGVRGYGTNGQGVYGESTGDAGVAGASPVHGVRGVSAAGIGVFGTGATGVRGLSDDGFAVRGDTTSGTGIYGRLEAGGSGHAGWFDGRVHVNGTLTKSAGSFRIDHPLDPAGKYLSHSFVESPDMKNIYDGMVTLDGDGTATVELPEWFEALNKDFRYQLTCIGEHAPVYIAEEIDENRFRIAGGYAGMKVSWQVTGTRHDPYAVAYPIPVEELKSRSEAGRFLHPELYGQPLTHRVAAVQR